MGHIEFLNITQKNLSSNENENRYIEQDAVIPSIRRQQYTKISPCDEDNDNHNMVDEPRFRVGSVALHILTCTLLIVYLASHIYYLVFKLQLYYHHFSTVLASPWLLLILICEYLYLLSSLISSVDTIIPSPVWTVPSLSLQTLLSRENYNSKHYIDLEKSDLTNHESICSSLYPTVNVLIPCCKEPTDVPIDTIRSTLALHYPKDRFDVMVLDDGADDKLEKFCESLETGGQLIYLRREKIPGVPHHFKCGNLNFGLKHSAAEYVAILDADMIPHPSFLDRLLPHIINSPDVAFVQAPQSFYNLPVGDPLNDSCSFGFHRMMPHRDTMGFASCVGSGVILRRKHLDSIGGFQPQSITEDTLTAYTLFNKGYKSVYINEKLQAGLVPWTFEGFIKQRRRWALGALQQFVATWKELIELKGKLNWMQKACYIWLAGYYFIPALNVVLVLTLWAALAFGLDLGVGTEEENRELLSLLALYLVSYKVFWIFLWLEVPQSVQSRNRDESQFWWMTPFFVKMLIDAALDFQKTYNFVPTSNVDQKAAAAVSDSQELGFMQRLKSSKKVRELRHLRVHTVFVPLVISTVAFRTYATVTRYDGNQHNCGEIILVTSLSFFLLTVCVHILVPILYVIFPPGYTSTQRKSLLQYNKHGVPFFDSKTCAPKCHFSSIFYEFISYFTIIFWLGIFWFMKWGPYRRWCN